MVIPAWDRNNLIPPIRPGTPEEEQSKAFVRSPYQTTLVGLVERFAVTAARVDLIRGLLDYRAALHEAGIRKGFQWVNGSFVERVEERESDPHTPNDVDVVTYYHRPNSPAFDYAPLFWPPTTKERFHIDAYRVQLGLMLDEATVATIAYWYGL